MSFAFGETVTVLRGGAVDRVVPGVAVEEVPPSSADPNPTAVTVKLYAPTGSDIRPSDRVRVRGVTLWVVGHPAVWRSPLSGWAPGVEVPLAVLYTTRVAVTRQVRDTTDPNGFGDLVDATVAADVPAHIEPNGGDTATRPGGTFTSASFVLRCAPCSLRAGDGVHDLVTGEDYTVERAFHIPDPTQPRVIAGLEQTGPTPSPI